MVRFLLIGSVAAFALWSGGEIALADDESFDRTPVDCVSVNRIRRTEVIDNQSILFFLRGGVVYRAMLPNECPGLAREQRFAYQVHGGRLCSTDTITVLERVGFGNTGRTCRLGQFYPTTPEALDELRTGPLPQFELVPVQPAPEESADDAEANDE